MIILSRIEQNKEWNGSKKSLLIENVLFTTVGYVAKHMNKYKKEKHLRIE